jgi:hypothetical protein
MVLIRKIVLLLLLALIPGCRADRYMKLYADARDYVRNDTTARKLLNSTDSIDVWVGEEIICLERHHLEEVDGWFELLGPVPDDPDRRRYLDDSIRYYGVLTPCASTRNPGLPSLSTTDDMSTRLLFGQIDSTLLPGMYMVTAYLHPPREVVMGRVTQMGRAYYIIFAGDGAIRKVFATSFGYF